MKQVLNGLITLSLSIATPAWAENQVLTLDKTNLLCSSEPKDEPAITLCAIDEVLQAQGHSNPWLEKGVLAQLAQRIAEFGNQEFNLFLLTAVDAYMQDPTTRPLIEELMQNIQMRVQSEIDHDKAYNTLIEWVDQAVGYSMLALLGIRGGYTLRQYFTSKTAPATTANLGQTNLPPKSSLPVPYRASIRNQLRALIYNRELSPSLRHFLLSMGIGAAAAGGQTLYHFYSERKMDPDQLLLSSKITLLCQMHKLDLGPLSSEELADLASQVKYFETSDTMGRLRNQELAKLGAWGEELSQQLQCEQVSTDRLMDLVQARLLLKQLSPAGDLP